MNSAGKILVISDLHLWGPEDPLYRALLKFIDEKITRDDKLFIIGDLFDLFVGNKKIFRERYFELLSKLQDLRLKNVEIFYIEGNHDFQLEGVFEDYSHIKLYADSLHYEWNGRKLHICHGDKINWKDFGYQFFRVLTHNLLAQCVIEAAPGALVDRVGSSMSKASRGQHFVASDDVVQLFRNYACEQITNGYDFVIMGHSHFLDDMKFRVAGHEGQYINSGYPRKHRMYFELKSGEKFFEMKSWEDIVVPFKPAQSKL